MEVQTENRKKKLDDKALVKIKDLIADGTKYDEVARIMTGYGYTRPMGGLLDVGDISYFLRKNGISKFTKRNVVVREQVAEEVTEDVSEVEQSEGTFRDPKLQASLELINCGKFSESQLLALMQAVLFCTAEAEAETYLEDENDDDSDSDQDGTH